MAAPRLRLRRGTDNPVTLTDVGEVFESGSATQALVGEPLFTDTNPDYVGLSPVTTSTEEGTGTGDFYIADGGSSFVHIGGSSYTARVDSFLVDQNPTDATGVSEGSKVVFEEGGPIGSAETITIQAPTQDDAINSYVIKLPLGAPTAAGPYLLEYDQQTSQLSFEPQVASEQLATRQAPDDLNATPDEYYLTFVANSNATEDLPLNPGTYVGQLETFYTEEQLVFLPDKDGNVGGNAGISSLKITGEYVASTGYFSGTGSTDTASVTTNFATEPTASGNTKAVNVGTGAASGSTTNINIGSAVGGKTDFLGTDDNTLGTAASGAVQMDGGLGVEGNATVGGDLSVVGGDIVADPANLSNTAQLFNTSEGTVNVANSAITVDEYSAATSLDIGYNGTANSTTSIAVGAVATGNTKTVNIGTGTGEGTTNINIGTGGATNSTTNVTIGSTTDQDSTTVTINGNLNVLGSQTTTNINTTNTNVQDALLALNSGMAANANNSNDVGLFIERGNNEGSIPGNPPGNIFVGYDESADFFVMAYIDSAKTAGGSVTFDGAIVSGDAAETPRDFLPLQIGELRFSDSTSRRGDGLSAEAAQVDDVVIGHLTASEADTEFAVTDGIAGRHVYNVVIDGGSF